MNKRFLVLASGRGSNFQAIIDKVTEGFIGASCAGLIVDNFSAFALTRAKEANIPAEVVNYKGFPDRVSYEKTLIERIAAYKPDLVVLAGYMRLLGKEIVTEWDGRMMNIHPSLLPSFAGLHAQQQAIDYGVRFSGCTVHFVTADMDAGPVIIQRNVPVFPDDDEDSLADRILVEEHIAYPEAVKLYFAGKLKIEGRKVIILP